MNEDSHHTVLCALVSRFIRDSLPDCGRWRHHQRLGVLQAYVTEGEIPGDDEYRVHVWHPSLVDPGKAIGAIHDHRFRMQSTVLLGEVHDTEYLLADSGPAAAGRYVAWDVRPARAAIASGKGTLVPSEDKKEYVLHQSAHTYKSGARYTYPPRRFHSTRVYGLAVTVVKKSEQTDQPARLLVPAGETPQFGFELGRRNGLSPNAIAIIDTAGQMLARRAVRGDV